MWNGRDIDLQNISIPQRRGRFSVLYGKMKDVDAKHHTFELSSFDTNGLLSCLAFIEKLKIDNDPMLATIVSHDLVALWNFSNMGFVTDCRKYTNSDFYLIWGEWPPYKFSEIEIKLYM